MHVGSRCMCNQRKIKSAPKAGRGKHSWLSNCRPNACKLLPFGAQKTAQAHCWCWRCTSLHRRCKSALQHTWCSCKACPHSGCLHSRCQLGCTPRCTASWRRRPCTLRRWEGWEGRVGGQSGREEWEGKPCVLRHPAGYLSKWQRSHCMNEVTCQSKARWRHQAGAGTHCTCRHRQGTL